jgi:hypothetical protein
MSKDFEACDVNLVRIRFEFTAHTVLVPRRFRPGNEITRNLVGQQP